MDEYKNVIVYATLTIIDSCVFCYRPLTKKFPKDFPEMFKMCCFCLNYAESITTHGRKGIIDHYGDGDICIGKILKERLYKIEKRITLVGK